MKKRKQIRRSLYILLFIVYLLHNDLWLWNDATLVMGIPIGLFYHIMFCVVASAVLCMLVTYAWPEYLEDAEEGEKTV